ncbi:MAG: methyltransferase domain-containing protein [Myxococcota bacterium]
MDNSEQSEFWNGPTAHKWVQRWQEIDAVLAPLGNALLAQAGARPGARVLDVGCGHGTTSLALAEAVGERGHVLGLDVSDVILQVARLRRPYDAAQLRFEAADAAEHPLGAASWDLVVSRFGVMFFDDPVQAFRRFRHALRPSGRLVFVCWQPLDHNPWMWTSVVAAKPYLPALSSEQAPEPDGPGAFSLADPARVRRILADAGFTQLRIEPLTPVLAVGPTPERAAEFIVDMGPVGAHLRDADDAAVAQVVRSVADAYRGEDPTPRRAGAWLVSATAP